MQNISLAGWQIVIAGGDAREVVLAAQLQRAGADVWMYGFEQHKLCAEVTVAVGLPAQADVIILPLPGVKADGTIYATYAAQPLHLSDLSPLLRKGSLLISGKMPPQTVELLQQQGVKVVLTAEMDELAIYNAVPTAEGAIELAMRESAVTIYGSEALVIGFGRCGLPLARTLAALGANVTVAARRREVLALAQTLGFTQLCVSDLAKQAGEFDYIFNTVPALMLTETELCCVKKDAVLIDIASAPGGTDFLAAERLGLKAFLALGLPGKVAPVSAGEILARVYPHLIIEQGKGGE